MIYCGENWNLRKRTSIKEGWAKEGGEGIEGVAALSEKEAALPEISDFGWVEVVFLLGWDGVKVLIGWVEVYYDWDFSARKVAFSWERRLTAEWTFNNILNSLFKSWSLGEIGALKLMEN